MKGRMEELQRQLAEAKRRNRDDSADGSAGFDPFLFLKSFRSARLGAHVPALPSLSAGFALFSLVFHGEEIKREQKI